MSASSATTGGPSPPSETYKTQIAEVERIVGRLQTCDDVDEALALYEDAVQRLRRCDDRLKHAMGRFEELKQMDDPPTAENATRGGGSRE